MVTLRAPAADATASAWALRNRVAEGAGSRDASLPPTAGTGPLLFGYARVSTDEQDTTAQLRALRAAGCERIFGDRASRRRRGRPQLQRLLEQLREAGP